MIDKCHLDYLAGKYASFRDGDVANMKCVETSEEIVAYLKPFYPDARVMTGSMAMAPLQPNPYDNHWLRHYWVSVAGIYLDFTASQFGHPFPFVILPAENAKRNYYDEDDLTARDGL